MLDTHCHIDLYPNPELILNECERNDFSILSMTNLPSHFEKGYQFFQNRKRLRIALGMHPLYSQFHEEEFPGFIRNLSKTSYIGEVGLDFSKLGANSKETQIQSFERILKLIAGQRKLLSIHSRGAEKEVLDLLKKYEVKNAIFHWYSGGHSTLEEIVRQRYFLSINPQMTKSNSGRNIISRIPKTNVLTETDGPFVNENNVPLKPGQVQTVIDFLAKEWQVGSSEVKRIVWSNFRILISQL